MMQLPTKIGPLTLMRQLKEDGLTEDYAGILDEPAGQQVYVRRLVPGIARDGMIADNVRKRVADLTGIENPALCHVRELVSHEGDLLFVEDWVDAVPLGHIIQGLARRGDRLPAEVLLHLAVKACNALEALHGRPGRMSGTASVLHMALSPDAFLLTPSGDVILGSYGVLRSPLSAPPGMTGSVMAPLNYLAPEQTRPDGGLSTASDIFALGSVLYEAATGHPMFTGDSQMAVVSEIRKADITAQLIEARNVVEGLDRVLQRCFAADPRHRFQRAFVLREDLRALMANYSFGNIEESTARVLAPFFSADTSGSSLPPPSTPDDTGGILLSALGAANNIDLPRSVSSTSTLVPADDLQDSIDDAFGRPSTDEVPTTIPSRRSTDFSEIPTDIPPSRPTLSPPDDDDDVVPSPQSLGDETSWVQSTPSTMPADATGWIQNPRPSGTPFVHDEGTDSVVIPDSEDTGSIEIPEDTGPVPAPAPPQAPPAPQASQPVYDNEEEEESGGSSMLLIVGAAAVVALLVGFVVVGGGGLAAAGLFLNGSKAPVPAEQHSVADASPSGSEVSVEKPSETKTPATESPATNGSSTPPAGTPSSSSGTASNRPPSTNNSSGTSREATTTPRTNTSSSSPRTNTSSASSGGTRVGSTSPRTNTAAMQNLAPPPPAGTGDDELQFEVEGDLSVLSERARSGELTDAERQKLESTAKSDPEFTRANVILYQDAKSRRDLAGRAKYLDQLMKLPENTYNPQFLVEQADLDLRSKNWDAAIDHAGTAERYWARLPSDLIFSRKAMIYEAQAGGWQGKFYASGGEDAESLRHAIRSWEKYENHVGTKNRADLALRANDQLTKLREMQRRLEY